MEDRFPRFTKESFIFNPVGQFVFPKLLFFP